MSGSADRVPADDAMPADDAPEAVRTRVTMPDGVGPILVDGPVEVRLPRSEAAKLLSLIVPCAATGPA